MERSSGRTVVRAISLVGLWWMLHPAPAVVSQTVPLRLGPVEAACRFDTTAFRDTASFTLYLAPPQPMAGGDAARKYAPFVAAVASNFQSPGSVSLATWPGTFYVGSPGAPGADPLDGAVGPLAGTLRIELRKGRVRRIAWEMVPDSWEVTQAVRAAVERADSLGNFLGLKLPPGSPGGAVRLGLRTSATAAPPDGWPILRVRMPYLKIETPATPLRIPTPVYPYPAWRRAVDGHVALQFIIEENGRVRPESIRVLEANYREFADAGVQAILGGEFNPATAGGCPVKALVQQSIRFSVR